MGILLRWLGAFLLLTATFNPTPYNFAHWAQANWQSQTPLTLLFGLLLAVGYIIYVGATFRSLGAFGMIVIAALFGAVIWVLIDWGILKLGNSNLTVWLGIRLSWSILRQRLSGQATVDEVES
jgi:hypothetical protein